MNHTTAQDKWRAVAAATGPADRAAAEAGVRLAYRTAGLAEPGRVLWADSPLAAVTLVRGLTDPGRSVRDEVRTRPWAEERRRLHDALGPAGWAAHWQATGAGLWDLTRALAERIRAGVTEAATVDRATAEETAAGTGAGASGPEATAVRLVLLDAVLGQHDAAWLAAFDGRGERLAGLAAVAEHAGWWWPFANVAVVCERPVELHRDEAGRLDRGDGPALAYADGFALHAWRGMPVAADFLAGLADLTPERIRAEENAELRRVMLEYYGYDRYLAVSGARHEHRDETGVLWRVELADDEDVVMVEVVNSTPEPDGSHRTYWLRVPPSTRTAREGVAWTFGLAAEAYEPLVQT
ncbi:hypothetical protein AQF52_6537 [Streptomyces venezuelae]|uniref:DUF6745 domain-containing protein n=1 Tax=Streptomyces gardneri TaxID=66892 RepID=UPI0006BD8129|nr:hypothetical protein [Streptomyces gardneri]ALO12130.1 hypothetical protein AQF52_6537 [Streptomyces venezuelae]QPK48959.1 hypothetical protein H4W23_32820 [Streptomyces gardneri]WRK40446.1 hypothetical protein U0M97_32980 [Streptomyces venezuelae]CUM37294.1 FIG01124133: hypothetical protein [Streptomyces venezuelae]